MEYRKIMERAANIVLPFRVTVQACDLAVERIPVVVLRGDKLHDAVAVFKRDQPTVANLDQAGIGQADCTGIVIRLQLRKALCKRVLERLFLRRRLVEIDWLLRIGIVDQKSAYATGECEQYRLCIDHGLRGCERRAAILLFAAHLVDDAIGGFSGGRLREVHVDRHAGSDKRGKKYGDGQGDFIHWKCTPAE